MKGEKDGNLSYRAIRIRMSLLVASMALRFANELFAFRRMRGFDMNSKFRRKPVLPLTSWKSVSEQRMLKRLLPFPWRIK